MTAAPPREPGARGRYQSLAHRYRFRCLVVLDGVGHSLMGSQMDGCRQERLLALRPGQLPCLGDVMFAIRY